MRESWAGWLEPEEAAQLEVLETQIEDCDCRRAELAKQKSILAHRACSRRARDGWRARLREFRTA